MKWLIRWVSKEESLLTLFKQLPALVGILMALGIPTSFILGALVPVDADKRVEDLSGLVQVLGATTFAVLSSTLLPAVEEFLFRFLMIGLPLFVYMRITKREPRPIWLIAPVVVSSVLFGYAHGSPAFIAMQGVGGAIFALVYLKWSGGGHRIFKGYCASTVTHGATNGTLILLSFTITALSGT